jgi:phage/plasmid-like protein (TIGR03299 family)
MAHNIYFNQNTGRHSFFSVKEKAWHGLGQIVSDYPTSKEAMQFAGLDFEVAKTPLFTGSNFEGLVENLQGINTEIKSHFATMRMDTKTVLGVVGKDYQLVQNTDAFSFFDSIVGGEGILYETAGVLGQGEKIFITAKLPDYIRVGNEDMIEKYLFLTTSHDGSGSITAAFTPIRIVCNNTLNAALRNKSNAIKIRHTSGAKERLETAHKVMGMSNTFSQQLEGVFNHWTKVRISDPELKKLIQLAMCPNKETLGFLKSGNEEDLSTLFKNTCEEVLEYALASETQQTETTKGTVFGAYNAVTGFYQNVRNFRDGESKLKSLMFGGTAQIRSQAAFNLCEAYTKSGVNALLVN